MAEMRRELEVEIEARVGLAQRLEHKSDEAARLERQNAVLLQHLREGGAREDQVREATSRERDAFEKLQRALAVNSKLRAKVGMLEQELEVCRGARTELEKSLNVQTLLVSAELDSTDAIHSSMAQVSAAPTPAEALRPLGELAASLDTYRNEWSKAQAPIELDALRGAFAHLSSKLQEAETSRQEAANAVVQMQLDLQRREQERVAAAELAAAEAAAGRPCQVGSGSPAAEAVAGVPLPPPPSTGLGDFSFAEASGAHSGAVGDGPESPLNGFFEPSVAIASDGGGAERVVEHSRANAASLGPPPFPEEVGSRPMENGARFPEEHTPSPEHGSQRHHRRHGQRNRSHRKGHGRRGGTPMGVADIQCRLQEILAARQRSMDNFSTEAVRQLAEQEIEEDRLKRKLQKLLG